MLHPCTGRPGGGPVARSGPWPIKPDRNFAGCAAPVSPDPNLLQKAGETRRLRAPTKILRLVFQTRGKKYSRRACRPRRPASCTAIYASNNTGGKAN
jgi:hypothetical protein